MSQHHTNSAPLPGPRCATFADLLPVLDEEATELRIAAEVRVHLGECAYCQARQADYLRMDAALRHALGADGVPWLKTEEIMADLFESDAPNNIQTPRSTLLDTASDPEPRAQRRWFSGMASLAAVLALAVLAAAIFGSHTRFGTTTTHLAGTPTVAPGVVRGSQSDLRSVSMVSADEGWAIGGAFADGDTSHEPVLLLHYSHGTWTRTPVSFTGHFQGISMASATDGWAIGWKQTFAHYTAGHWVPVTIANGGNLQAIQMLGPADGWVVGEWTHATDVNFNDRGGILHYDGTEWRQQTLPAIPGVTDRYSVELTALSMLSATEGWAVGEAQPMGTGSDGPNGTTAPTPPTGVILHYTGGKWTLAQVMPATSLTSIALASAAQGWATGYRHTYFSYTPVNRGTQVDDPQPLLLRLDAGQWVTAPLPAVDSYYQLDQLSHVAMRSPSDGWMTCGLGQMSLDARVQPCVLHYDGSAWKRVSMPTITRRASVSVDQIGVTAAGDVVMVGTAYWPREDGIASGGDSGYAPTMTPLLLRYHAGVWSVVQS